MTGLKEIRTRIASVKSTRKITSAMKMVAAARLRKTQDRIIQLRPYTSKLDEILKGLQYALEGNTQHPLIEDRNPDKVLLVLLTSNRGLCGGFNANAMKHAVNLAQTTYTSQLKAGNLFFYCIGRKGNEYLEFKGYQIYKNNNEIYDNLNFQATGAISEELMEKFTEGEFDRIDFIYNQFKNAVVQNLTIETFLPLKFETAEPKGKNFNYIFEPDADYLIRKLIPRTLKIKVFKIILDSYTSEQGARMTAMHQATDNASDLIRELTLHYNKARQAAITKELLDIVGGAEALR